MTHTVNRDTSDMVHRGSHGLAALGAFLVDLGKELGWHTGADYQGHNLTRKDDGWLLVLKAEKKGQAVVAFIGGPSPLECYRNLWVVVTKGQVRWKTDRFRKET